MKKSIVLFPIIMLALVATFTVNLFSQEDCCKPLGNVSGKKAGEKTETQQNATNFASLSPSSVSLYRVPLVCPAAPEIGCGSKAKPILRQLEQHEGVSQAWLNREGTILAIVWKPQSKHSLKTKTITDVCDKEKLTLTELKNKEYEQAFAGLKSGQGWYRENSVDQLSMRESEVIVERLIRRMKAKVSLSDEKTDRLQSELLSRCRDLLVGKSKKDRQGVEEELYQGVQSFLNQEEIAAIREAIALGFQSLENEK